MRQALRRVLWLLPTLLLISVAAFWLVTPQGGSLPKFVNAEPRSVDQLADTALDAAARGDRAAQRELVRLGGAGLPFVLPKLDTLPPQRRARVALGLMPLARRMGVQTDGDDATPQGAVLFWTRFWQDRAIDFRPAVVRRAVRRVIDRPSALRRADLRALDTYALPELIAQLEPIRNVADVKRAHELGTIAARATGRQWLAPRDASPAVARAEVRRWKLWWNGKGPDFKAPDAMGRLGGMVRQTQYGVWANRTALEGLPDADGASFMRRTSNTALLMLAGATGVVAIALLLGWATAQRFRWFAIATPLAGVPSIAWMSTVRDGGLLTATLAMALAGGVVYAIVQRSALSEQLSGTRLLGQVALGAAPWRVAMATSRLTIASATSLIGAHTPLLLTGAFVAEHLFGLSGLGPPTIRAVQTGDTAWLMAVAICSAAMTALGQIASDVMLWLADPRSRPALRRRRTGAD